MANKCNIELMFFRPVLGNPTKSPSFRPNFQSKTGKKHICSCVGHVKSHPIRVAFAPNAGIENKLSLHRRNRFLPGKPPSQAPQPPFPGTEKHGAAEVCLPSAALCRDRWPPAFPDRREHPFFHPAEALRASWTAFFMGCSTVAFSDTPSL